VSAYTPPPPPLYLRETRPPPDPAAVPVIPGGGLTRRILTSISPEKRKDWNVPVVALLQFVFEGDNRGDAGLLVAIVNKLLDLNLKGAFLHVLIIK
jgi:proteasome assembly chaperone 2